MAAIARILAVLMTILVVPASAVEPMSDAGISRISFQDGERTLALTIYYPARPEPGAKPFFMPFYTKINLYPDAPPLAGDTRRPLIIFSHGRGSNALLYAWFGQYLAQRGFIVAAIDHYRANSYDMHIAYLSSLIWQRPVDVGKAISFLLADPKWSALIDAEKIGVSGHSQGGFTSLWAGGAEVNEEKFRIYQERWHNNAMVPEHLRREIPVDPKPALAVADPRIKAAFAMAPGIIKAFGMDEASLAKMKTPAYITVGARDTQTPPGPNAEFAAAHIPGAKLVIIPGLVDHEIFVNECDEEGRDEFPEGCIDAAGVDRAAIHGEIGQAAVAFFREALGIQP